MQQEIKINNQIKLTKTITLILLIYTICWTIPTLIWLVFLVGFTIFFVYISNNFKLLDPSNTMRISYASHAQGYITAGGCGLNLYIYLFKHAEIRHYAFKLIGFKGKPTADDAKKWAIHTQIQQHSTNQH